MKVGTRSILYGAHCWFIHPFFVFLAWWKLYGFPWDPRLWVAFFVHDLGYWGKPNIDGPEGETHVEFGAKIMSIFDIGYWIRPLGLYLPSHYWHDLSLYHSRFYAKNNGRQFSRLCVADKLAICLEPWWLYLPRVILSGEVEEFKAAAQIKYAGEMRRSDSNRAWRQSMVDFLLPWIEANKGVPAW